MMVRDELLDSLRRELVGPGSDEEVLLAHEAPRVRYGAGILFPRQLRTETQEDASGKSSQADEEGVAVDAVEDQSATSDASNASSLGDSADVTDAEIARANDYLPSAMGLTFIADLSEGLKIDASFGQYLKQIGSGGSRSWKRKGGLEKIDLGATELLGDEPRLVTRSAGSADPGTEISIRVFVRAAEPEFGRAKVRRVTISLLNDTPSPGTELTDGCLYQCRLEVSLGNPEAPVAFLPIPARFSSEEDGKEKQSGELLYRHRRVYAVGHGVAPDWSEDAEVVCRRVFSQAVPHHEIKPILPRTVPGLELKMADLGVDGEDSGLKLCSDLLEHYENWITDREEEAGDADRTPEHLSAVASSHLASCRDSLSRMKRGVEILASVPKARRAFALMNQAMLRQQIHYKDFATQPRDWSRSGTDWVLEQRYTTPDYKSANNAWRPFQIAFILMTIPSIVLDNDADFAERDLVDVIWFPTGGGKTEAYLGLAAFTILWRRLTDRDDAGCTVLMRYTLRLLTTQQFERAASLICALELIRQRDDGESLGKAPISIGLWVGGAVTPNKRADAVSLLNKFSKGEAQNPFVILKCPWCGARMGRIGDGRNSPVRGYRKTVRPSSVMLCCDDPNCEFSDPTTGLPVLVIDEEIYESPPTLLVGTVDKFALLPWYPQSRSLFGIGQDVSPPDLIIQDELHLISGPLGSMVGHYETLIDEFCTRQEGKRAVRGKVIASTATVARAAEQVAALYGRFPAETRLFPPQGLKSGDSFFAMEDEDGVGRLYVGVFPSGLPSQVTAQVRVIAALLQAVPMTGRSAVDIDPYWSMMVYFNSIRELGHAATLIAADIPEYTRVLWRRFGLGKGAAEDRKKLRRYINQSLELTSRVSSSEVTAALDALFNRYPGKTGQRPVDVCLATNMIQVGLDVSRLGLMTVIGQPKTTAEYIQATSRVGRDKAGPGLVVTVLNTGKPRDRSHYEHFRDYHQSIYRHVEPTSVTPFSIRVSERALHALVIALVRFWSGGDRAYPEKPDRALRTRVKDVILSRAEVVDPGEQERIDHMIDLFFAEWDRWEPDTFGSFSDTGEETPLMRPAGSDRKPIWPLAMGRETPSSMRSVDASCEVEPIYSYDGAPAEEP